MQAREFVREKLITKDKSPQTLARQLQGIGKIGHVELEREGIQGNKEAKRFNEKVQVEIHNYNKKKHEHVESRMLYVTSFDK